MALTQVPIELSSTPGIVDNSNATAITIDSSENVGIGASFPGAKLEAAGNLRITNATVANSAIFQVTSDATGSNGVNLEATYYGSGGFGPIKFTTSNTERMRIESAGTVKITHADTASEGFRVIQTTAGRTSGGALGLFYDDQAGTTQPTLVAQQNGTGDILQLFDGASQVVTVKDGGNLLVGGTSLGQDDSAGFTAGGILTIARASGVNRNMILFKNAGSQVGSITTTTSATSYNTSSDYRLKENVVALTGATERLKQLNPSRFNFIADPDSTVDGFLAHEVQDVVPEAITGTHNEVDDDGNPVYQGIDQSKLVPLLVATIQELEARITQLENN